MSATPKINKRILVAPLDWGLGHATRCIPIIRHLSALGCEVWIATAGMQETLLQTEFPDAGFLHLPGYGVQYGRRLVMLRLLRQIPVIRRHIFTEHAWLQQVIREYDFDAVISDNRYGLYSRLVPSVLITHQLALQLPKWAGIFRSGVQQMLYHHIEHFNQCWVPDLPDASDSLAGDMSHPATLPNIPVQYIGWLSRFEQPATSLPREEAILISLSGPEPQRTMLEEKILADVQQLQKPVWLVRGLPGAVHDHPVPSHVTVYNHLPASEMQQYMLRCRLLVSRSGYSTLMDAMVLDTPLACIPTPGQTEQEYLSERLDAKGWAVTQSQENLQLSSLIQKAACMPHKKQEKNNENLLLRVLMDWVNTL